MAKKRGRPPKRLDKILSERIEFRATAAEKIAFQDASDLSGMPISSWIRDRLRRAAELELKAMKMVVAFLEDLRSKGE